MKLAGLLVALLLSFGTFARADNFADMENVLTVERDTKNSTGCERALHSASLDRWIRAYLSSDRAGTLKEWKGVLAATGGAERLKELLSGVRGRMEFLDGDDFARYQKLGARLGMQRQIYADSKIILGPKSPALSSIAEFLSWSYMDEKDWPKSVAYAREALAIGERAFGRGDARTTFLVVNLSEQLASGGDLAAAKIDAQTALAMGRRYHLPDAVQRANILLIKLNRKRPPKISLLNRLLLPPCLAQGAEDAFATLEQGLVRKEEEHDQACCDRGIYSKSFDRWIQAFINGRDAEAEKEWAGVLQAARGAESIVRLGSCSQTRLDFLDGADAEKLEKRGGLITALKTMVESTGRILGKDSTQAGSLAHYLSDKYRGCGQDALAVKYDREYVRVMEKHYPPNDPRLFGSYADLAEKEMRAKDFVAARVHAEKALAMAMRAHAVPAQYRARGIINKLNTASSLRAGKISK